MEISLEKYEEMQDRIAKLTEENEELKQGNNAHWTLIADGIESDEAGWHRWSRLRCSGCGMEREVMGGYVPNYCEWCGAKMENEMEPE